MATSLSLSQQQKQMLKLSPAQIQVMRLLELPTCELVAQINEELQNNPALEEGIDNNAEIDEIQPVEEEYENPLQNEDFDYNTYTQDDDIAEHMSVNNGSRDMREEIPFSMGTSFAEYLEQGPCLFIGDGAGKCADVIKHPNAQFCQCWPKASAMLVPAMAAYKEKRFEDVAYFEPFYLKEFVATVSKKKLW